MKPVKLVTSLLLSVLVMSSCDNAPSLKIWEYQPVMFQFKDASNKDLVKDFVMSVGTFNNYRWEYDESYLRVEAVYPQPCMDPVEAYLERFRKIGAIPDYPNFLVPRLNLFQDQDIWELGFKPETSDQCPMTKTITLKLTSPLFGDNEEHEFIFHFKSLRVSRILMDGKECHFVQRTMKNSFWHKQHIRKPETAQIAFAVIVL